MVPSGNYRFFRSGPEASYMFDETDDVFTILCEAVKVAKAYCAPLRFICGTVVVTVTSRSIPNELYRDWLLTSAATDERLVEIGPDTALHLSTDLQECYRTITWLLQARPNAPIVAIKAELAYYFGKNWALRFRLVENIRVSPLQPTP